MANLIILVKIMVLNIYLTIVVLMFLVYFAGIPVVQVKLSFYNHSGVKKLHILLSHSHYEFCVI